MIIKCHTNHTEKEGEDDDQAKRKKIYHFLILFVQFVTNKSAHKPDWAVTFLFLIQQIF